MCHQYLDKKVLTKKLQNNSFFFNVAIKWGVPELSGQKIRTPHARMTIIQKTFKKKTIYTVG
jgi:hypothetical protein